ncbi:hypothetical protein V5E97_27715 [Singulisphaera sp. Ch08]|uniref:Uncharacterized protein n=1 Tax=Singulisphaera sp. Ch08 TaxID=3120278 RepID=A0AAU7CAQ8_9BACT
MVEPARRRIRAHMLVLLFAVSVLGGLHNALTWESEGIKLALTFLTASVVTQCCIADSKVIGKPILLSFQWLMFLSWAISAPMYLVWTRRFRGLGLAIGYVLLYLIVQYLTFIAMASLVHGPAFFHQIRG